MKTYLWGTEAILLRFFSSVGVTAVYLTLLLRSPVPFEVEKVLNRLSAIWTKAHGT